jgi:hydrogenase large subunit
MATKIVIDPVTRIEGHLKIEAVVENGVVKEARSSGTLFRGFEILLKGRHPLDAQHLVQRVCGVCPTAHAMAAALNLDSAFGIADQIPENGRIIRNLIAGANYLQSHIIHFYHLAALDYVDISKVANYEGKNRSLLAIKDLIRRAQDVGDSAMLGPFYPRYEGDYRLSDEVNQQAVAHYVQALDARRLAHEMSAIFSGKMPHNMAITPGGVTELATVDKIASFTWKLHELQHFIDDVYLPDVFTVANAYPDYFGIGKGPDNLLSYGVFDLEVAQTDLAQRRRFLPQGRTSLTDLDLAPLDPSLITEDVHNSWYQSGSGLYPGQGETDPDPFKADAYSWIKAPRYGGDVYEVGPLARVAVGYAAGDNTIKEMVNDALARYGADPEALSSVMGRHAARVIECKIIADEMADWVTELKPDEPVRAKYEIPMEGKGMGLWEAPRGALGHWVNIREGKIHNYQLVVPTTWNASPADDQGQPGPMEQALLGTKMTDEANPFELVRIVRSFDPCLACAIHVITPKGSNINRLRVV